MPKLDRRTLKTRKAITDAAWKLLKTINFDQLTIIDITEEANINRSTFYLHYEDKYDLKDEMIKDLLHQFSKPDPVGTTNIKDMTRRHFENTIQNIEAYIFEFGILFEHAEFFDFQSWVIQLYMDKINRQTGLTTDEKDQQISEAIFYLAGFQALTKWWVIKNRPITTSRLIDLLEDYHRKFFLK